eukprot:Trichotokara_eunicae@DN6302_c1_g1_i10.p1
MHFNQNYMFVTKMVQKDETVESMMKKYEVSMQEKGGKEKLVDAMVQDFLVIHMKVAEDLLTMHHCLGELERLALRQYPLGVAEYVDMLIFAEKQECRPGWENRLCYLEGAKKAAVVMEQAGKGVDPQCKELAVLNSGLLHSNINESGGILELHDFLCLFGSSL